MSLRMITDALACRSLQTHCPLCGRSFAKIESSEEHIFPKWLQHHHDLWTQRLTIPNLLKKQYKSVKIRICQTCNNKTYGKRETLLSQLFVTPHPYAAVSSLPDESLAIWLGKIFWLLCRKSNSVPDFKARDQNNGEMILPTDLMRGTLYAGLMQRAFAMNKKMVSCHLDDPAHPEFYVPPYSLYRFEIDTRDSRFSQYDFIDNTVVLGVAIRSGTLGLVCVFDGGLHQRVRAHRFQYLNGHQLHPIQFNEVVARVFYDQTVLDDRARNVTYFWNKPLKSVVSMTHTPSFYDPYLLQNHDPKRLATLVGRYTFANPRKLLTADGRVFTCLQDSRGNFLPYAITQEELQAVARKNPDFMKIGPMDSKWRDELDDEFV